MMSPVLPIVSTARPAFELMLPVPPVLEVTEALVKVTVPKSAREVMAQFGLHTSGASTIHSALEASGAGVGLAIGIENAQAAVESVTLRVHVLPDSDTDALTASPGDTGYRDVESVVR
jgi:hypothetical protein